jgi:hypothetical protein
VAANTTREQAATALFALVTGAVPTLKRKERHFRLPEDVSPAQTPALFQVQSQELYERTPGKMIGIPPKRTLVFQLIVYVTDAANTVGGVTTVGSTQLNEIIQAIESALLPQPGPDLAANLQTLGQIVQSARIEGELVYHEATQFDGLSAVTIPVAVLFP